MINITQYNLCFHSKSGHRVNLPVHKAAMLRGALLYELVLHNCVDFVKENSNCACKVATQCACTAGWAAALKEHGNYENPKPFVLQNMNLTSQAVQDFELRLTIFSQNAYSHLEHVENFLNAIEIAAIRGFGYQSEPFLLDIEPVLLDMKKTWGLGDLNPVPKKMNKLQFTFQTLTEIGSAKNENNPIELKQIISSLLERYKKLNELYGSGNTIAWNEMDLENIPNNLLQSSNIETVSIPNPKSGNNVGKFVFTGFRGNLEYSYHESLQPFLGLLQLGQFMYVGKECVYGHGKYKLKFL